MKTNKSASKRFRVTRKGKVVYVHSGLRHNLEHKSGKQKRAIARPATLAEVDRPEILRLLGRR
jgi:large subunit ribosomal protein L35